MSVYATVLMIQHPDAVKEQLGEQLTIVGDDSHERELGSPRLYQGSHVIPAASDKRGGVVEVGAIPAFVEDRRQGLPEEEVREEGWLPYVRLSVSTQVFADRDGEDTVVLDSDQVRELRDTLSRWLDGAHS